MAKQLGIIQYSGKLGQTVGAKKARSQSANVMRAHSSTISNPKTLAQREQRIKMAPAVNLYRALSEIVDHAFQSKTYGAGCHQEFLKRAMLMSPGTFPYLVKGDYRPIPGYYLVASGAIAPLDFTLENEGIAINGITGFDVSDEWGAASKDFINKNPQLKNGDQLTFVFCYFDSDDYSESVANPMWFIKRIVLDTASTESAIHVLNDAGISITDGVFNLGFDGFCAAGTVIISRPPLRKNSAWQRSNAMLAVHNGIVSAYMSASALTAALDSYAVKEAAPSSDYYLNQGSSSDEATTNVARVTVTASPSDGGTVTGGGSYEIGAEVTVRATAASGYTFDGWYIGSALQSTNANYSFILASNISLTAQFSSDDQP